jgi:hypothetical protein
MFQAIISVVIRGKKALETEQLKPAWGLARTLTTIPETLHGPMSRTSSTGLEVEAAIRSFSLTKMGWVFMVSTW